MAKRKRGHISLREKLASALAHILFRDEATGELAPMFTYEERKHLTANEILSLVQWDHDVLHANDGSDRHHNITPRFIGAHRRKTSTKDIPAVAKGKRLTKANEAFRARMLVKTGVDPVAETATTRHVRPKQKIRSGALAGTKKSGLKRSMDGKVTRRAG